MSESEVQLYIYDISKGMARAFSPMFLGGKQIDGVWHTGITVYNKEFFFGSMGIQYCIPGEMVIGRPDRIISLGVTQIPYDVLMDHIQELDSSTFRGSCYNLFEHNCNTFSNEIANFLTGKSIPSEITNLPREVLGTPIGAMIKQFADSASYGQSALLPEFPTGRARDAVNHVTGAHDIVPHSSQPDAGATHDLKETDAAAATPHRAEVAATVAPPVAVFTDGDILNKYKDCRDTLRGVLRPNEFQCIEEVFEYLSVDQVDWSLHRNHLSLLCKLVTDVTMTDDIRLLSGCLLNLALCRKDFVNVSLHDPTCSLFSLIRDSDGLPPQLLLILAKSFCNFLAEKCAVEWLLGHSVGNEPSVDSCEAAAAFCTRCIVDENDELADVGCRSASNIIQNGKLPVDLAFRIGVALIEVICSKEYQDQTEDYLWYSLIECIRVNDELIGFGRVRGLDLKTEEEKHSGIVKYTQTIRPFFL